MPELLEPGGDRAGEGDLGLDRRFELAAGRRGQVAAGAVADELLGARGFECDQHERVAPGGKLGRRRDRRAA